MTLLAVSLLIIASASVFAVQIAQQPAVDRHHHHGGGGQYDWDFLLYVERWPGTITQAQLPANITTFVLHGMWPERNDNSYPQNCPGSSYDNNKLNFLRDELKEYWPDLQFKMGSDYLWKHEWEKHGTCAADGTMNSISDQVSFFQFALNFHKQLPLRTALSNHNIYPGNVYDLSDIEYAISDSFNATMVLSCEHHSGSYSLMRVYSCISKSGYLVDCPYAVVNGLKSRANCGNGRNIAIPTINH